jgi:hypothetical protein
MSEAYVFVSPDARPSFQHRAEENTTFIDSSTETTKPSFGNSRLFSTPGASKTVQPFGNGLLSGLVLLNIYARAKMNGVGGRKNF